MKVSIEAILALALAAFVILWVVLQEFGTVLLWLLIIGAMVKIAQYLSHITIIRVKHIPSNVWKEDSRYPRAHVSKPVTIDRINELSKPLDKEHKWV